MMTRQTCVGSVTIWYGSSSNKKITSVKRSEMQTCIRTEKLTHFTLTKTDCRSNHVIHKTQTYTHTHIVSTRYLCWHSSLQYCAQLHTINNKRKFSCFFFLLLLLLLYILNWHLSGVWLANTRTIGSIFSIAFHFARNCCQIVFNFFLLSHSPVLQQFVVHTHAHTYKLLPDGEFNILVIRIRNTGHGIANMYIVQQTH